MKVTVESTSHIVEVNGHPARVWQGMTANGIDVVMVVCQVASPSLQDQSELRRDLTKHADPDAHALHAFPLRMVL